MSRRVSSRLTAKDTASSIPKEEDSSQKLTETIKPPAAPKGKKPVTPNSSAKRSKPVKESKTVDTEPAATPNSAGEPTDARERVTKTKKPNIKLEQDQADPPSTNRTKRKRVAEGTNIEEDEDELPHNMGKRPTPSKVKKEDDAVNEDKPSLKKARTAQPATKVEHSREAQEVVNGAGEPPKKKPKKANPYGLTPGETPFPDWLHPTAKECQTVHDLLLNWIPAERRKNFGPPDTIPAPSEVMAGCGEVPSIMDALIRTLLSAATTGKNSSTSFQGLIQRFGKAKEGVGKGSVNWNAVHEAPLEDVIEAIKHGGLAVNKGKNIKKILEMVHAENKERLAMLEKAKQAGEFENEADEEERAEKEVELRALQQGHLTLDYYHHLEKNEAMTTFTKLPGIGVKTAACVNMFCMQRPCFAVDTHVFRLCQYLGWVPPAESRKAGQKKVDRDTTFSHCEVRVPDELKYMLHQLFLAHGKACPRCRAITGENSEGWADANCPIEHLVKRLGAKKGELDSPQKKPPPKRSKGKKDDSEEESGSEPDNKSDEIRAPTKTAPRRAPRRKAATPSKTTKMTKGKTQSASKKASGNKREADLPDETEEGEEDEDEDMSDLTDAPESDGEDSEY